MVSRSFHSATIGFALATLAGCSSDESVLLEAKLEAPALTVTVAPLVTELQGSFDIELSLGDLASDPTTVKLGTFSLQRDDRVLFGPLELTAMPEFPLDVGVGKSKHVDMTIDRTEGPTGLADELCSAPLQVRGTLTDTLGDDRSLTVTSPPFNPECFAASP